MSTVIEAASGESQATLNYTTSEAGNPFVEGWYADPGSAIYDGVFWVYPTSSCSYEEQTYIDAFSSPDLINWTKYPNVLAIANVAWATKALWSPTPIFRNGKCYLYFSANDAREDQVGNVGGIGVAVADKPEGPFVDAIGKPLIGSYHNGAQPTSQDVFIDDLNGKAYIYYGGNSHVNVALLNEDMISLGAFDDGITFKEITPKNYVNGPRMAKRNGIYYFMWSEGSWAGDDYSVSYAMADNPLGPFDRLATILQQDSAVAKGTGHNSVIHVPDTDIWYILYHRRPLSETDRNHRTLAYDRMHFNEDDTIQPIAMLVKDNFADGAMLDWTTYGGEWSVEGQRLTAKDMGGGMAMLDTNFADLVFDATVATIKGNGHPGLLFRVTELSDITHKYKGYKAAISPSGVITLGKADLGTFTDLAQTRMDMVLGREYHVRVVAIGSDIKIFVDDMGKAKIQFTDGSFATGANGVRVFNAAAKFGSVSVARPGCSQNQRHIPSIISYDDSSSASSWDDVPDKFLTDQDLDTFDEAAKSETKLPRLSPSFLLCGASRLFKINKIPKS
ncbi:putative glycosyl hydrolase [Xylaria cf. heliscus]|nr:putative glycosyl hydrolase [Xylaria cf. heliscus]